MGWWSVATALVEREWLRHHDLPDEVRKRRARLRDGVFKGVRNLSSGSINYGPMRHAGFSDLRFNPSCSKWQSQSCHTRSAGRAFFCGKITARRAMPNALTHQGRMSIVMTLLLM